MKQVDVKRKPDRSHLITVWLLVISILFVGACVTAAFMVKRYTEKQNESTNTPGIAYTPREGVEVSTFTDSNVSTIYFVSEYYTEEPVEKYTEYYDPDNENAPYNAELEGFVSNLRSRGYAIKTLNLKECEEIPEDCALLIINNPAVDFGQYESMLINYGSDLEKIDKYMTRKPVQVVVNNADNVSLPRLEEFCRAKGIEYGNKPMLYSGDITLPTPVTLNPVYQFTSTGEAQQISTAVSYNVFELNTELNTIGTVKDNKAVPEGAALIFIILILLAPVAALPLGIIIIVKRKFSQGGES